MYVTDVKSCCKQIIVIAAVFQACSSSFFGYLVFLFIGLFGFLSAFGHLGAIWQPSEFGGTWSCAVVGAYFYRVRIVSNYISL
jgi:hypothetical protein